MNIENWMMGVHKLKIQVYQFIKSKIFSQKVEIAKILVGKGCLIFLSPYAEVSYC